MSERDPDIDATTKKGIFLECAERQRISAAAESENRAKGLKALLEDRFINPDGTTDMMVFTRDNFTEVRTIGDVDALKGLKRALKSIESNSDAKRIGVSPSLKAFFGDILDTVEVRLNQLSLSAGEPATKAEAKAAPKAKAPAASPAN